MCNLDDLSVIVQFSPGQSKVSPLPTWSLEEIARRLVLADVRLQLEHQVLGIVLMTPRAEIAARGSVAVNLCNVI